MEKSEFNLTAPIVPHMELAFNEEQRTVDHYISTEAVNCYGYRLKNDGMNTKDYNGVVLYQHYLGGFFSDEAPLPSKVIAGKNLKFGRDSKGVEAKTEFAKTELGEDVMMMNKMKLMNSWSVKWDFDGNNDFKLMDNVPTLPFWMLKEYSAVIIPGNPEAINKTLSFVKTESLRKSLSFDLALSSYKQEFENEFTELKNKLQSLSKEDSGKENADFKNEIKSLIGTNRKVMIDLLYSVTNRLSNLESNLHSAILSKMPNIIELAVRKYIGKVDD